MAKYTITNQKELRRSFWEFCKEFGGEFEREANKKKHSFKLDFNKDFVLIKNRVEFGDSSRPPFKLCVYRITFHSDNAKLREKQR